MFLLPLMYSACCSVRDFRDLIARSRVVKASREPAPPGRPLERSSCPPSPRMRSPSPSQPPLPPQCRQPTAHTPPTAPSTWSTRCWPSCKYSHSPTNQNGCTTHIFHNQCDFAHVFFCGLQHASDQAETPRNLCAAVLQISTE